MANAKIGVFIILAACAAASGARADLRLCSRMSYVAEAAIAVEEAAGPSTRGWFRLDPGQCRVVLQGAVALENVYVHLRVSPVYGPSPLPQSGHADFCVGTGETFTISGARNCRAGQSAARFTAIRPNDIEGIATAYLAEEAEYTDTQARDAGIQRLLVAAGYDATPIDGMRGGKTDVALVQFLRDNNLPPTSAGRSDFFDTLLAAAQRPGGGFTWCNETSYAVMAAIGIEDKTGFVARGWYRIEPNKCLRPDIAGQPLRLFSFAEAVDAAGQTVKLGDKPLAWGGDAIACTRNVKFELTDRADCAAKGLSSVGFAEIDLRGTTTVRFK